LIRSLPLAVLTLNPGVTIHDTEVMLRCTATLKRMKQPQPVTNLMRAGFDKLELAGHHLQRSYMAMITLYF